MDDNFNRIQKSFTTIAIFAGLVQISGFSALPFLGIEYQSLLIWFLIFFPVVFILLYFMSINMFIRNSLGSRHMYNSSKSGKYYKPAERSKLETKRRNQTSYTFQPTKLTNTEPYMPDLEKSADLTSEKFQKVKKSSGNSITWK